MRRIAITLLAFVYAFCITSCSVDEAEDRDHLVIYEKADEMIEINLSWKVNGEADEGMLTNMMLYISRSKDMSDAALDESLGVLTISYIDYYGNQRITPSDRYLFDAYRFYVGVAYHGVTPGASVAFPLNIEYTIDIVNKKTRETIKSIQRTMVINSNQPGKTHIEYIYTMDVMENEPDTEHRNYSLREMEKEIIVDRESDVQPTNVFSAEKNLYADLIWKVNGEVKAYKGVDLDLYLHDVNNTNVSQSDDLDDYSASENSYEGITIAPDNTYFKEGVPEKLGFYMFDNMSAGTSTVEYMYRIYSIDGRIKMYTLSGSFQSPPVEPGSGWFYFHADIVKSGTTYTVQPLTPALMWTP